MIDVTVPAAVPITTSDTTLSETILSILSGKRFRILVLMSLDEPATAESANPFFPPHVKLLGMGFDSIADLEHGIRTHETFKRASRTWLKLHIALSFTLYSLLALDLWATLSFGLWIEGFA